MAKLIIWDLDDTLWSGTLAEGDEPVLHRGRADAIRELNTRGVVHSICSKNDPAVARTHLERMGLWAEFVFPEIAFAPKGALVRQIIDGMQLRAADVVFIDDNPMNLREVAHDNPGIRVIDARGDEADQFLARLLADLAGVSKSRVNEYRVLEAKRADRRAALGSNEDFLASCGIKATLVRRTDNLAHAARIEELINRTNQLNFTRSRVPPGTIPEYLIDVAANETFSVFVWDRYGDYGLVGFASIERRSVLRHFLFSCRTMNMGIESAVAAALKKAFPAVEFPVATDAPRWVRFVPPDGAEFREKLKAGSAQPEDPPTVRVMANCQSGAIAHYMGTAATEFDNWPRVFTLESMLAGTLPPDAPGLLVYGAFNDYDTRYWATPPSLDVYTRAARSLADACRASNRDLIVITPPDEFHKERSDGGVTQARFATLNQVWIDLAQGCSHLHLIRVGHGDLAMANVADPRHFDRTILMGIAARAATLVKQLLARGEGGERAVEPRRDLPAHNDG